MGHQTASTKQDSRKSTNPVICRRITLKTDEDRNRCLHIYRPAVQKIGFVFVVFFNCIKDRFLQHERTRDNLRMKNIPILINFNRNDNGACDAGSPCVLWIITNPNFL